MMLWARLIVPVGLLLATGCMTNGVSVVESEAVAVTDLVDELLCAQATAPVVDARRNAELANEVAARGLTCPGMVAVAAVQPANPGATIARATGSVNMRAGPGTRHRVLGTLRAGDEVTVLSVQGTWCECMRTGQIRFFVSCRYLSGTGRSGPMTQPATGLYTRSGQPIMIVRRDGGTYSVPDFPMIVSEYMEGSVHIQIAENSDYDLWAIGPNRQRIESITISIGLENEARSGAIRQQAERALRNATGLTNSQLCRVDVTVIVQRSGEIGLSFCSLENGTSASGRLPQVRPTNTITLDIIPGAPRDDCYEALDLAGRQAVSYDVQGGVRYKISGTLYTFTYGDPGNYTNRAQTRDGVVHLRWMVVGGSEPDNSLAFDLEVETNNSRRTFRVFRFCPASH